MGIALLNRFFKSNNKIYFGHCGIIRFLSKGPLNSRNGLGWNSQELRFGKPLNDKKTQR